MILRAGGQDRVPQAGGDRRARAHEESRGVYLGRPHQPHRARGGHLPGGVSGEVRRRYTALH